MEKYRRQDKKKSKEKKKKLKQKLAAEEHGTTAAYYHLSTQYKPAYEDPPTLRNLPSEPNQEGHSDHNRMEEEKRKMLELLTEEFDLDYYSEPDSDSDSDRDYRYQMLV